VRHRIIICFSLGCSLSSGLVLTSSYHGQGHPTATLTITASNVTPGEGAISSPVSIMIVDPPAPSADHHLALDKVWRC
jgi:hypothetical protein